MWNKRKLLGRFVFILFMMMLVLLILTLLSYATVHTNMEQQLRRSAESALEDVVVRASGEVKGAINAGNTVSSFDEVYKFVDSSPIEQLQRLDNIRFMLSSYINLRHGLRAVYVYMPNGSVLSVTADMKLEHEQIACFAIKEDIIRSYHLQTPYSSSRLTCSYEYYGEIYYAVLIPIYPAAPLSYAGTYKGTLIFLYSASELSALLPAHESIAAMIADSQHVLAASSQHIVDRRDSTLPVLQKRVPGTEWTVYVMPSAQDISSTLRRFRTLCMAFAAATVVVFTLLMLIQYKSIVDPILTISDQTALLGTGENDLLTSRFEVEELDQLVTSINKMLVAQRETSREMLRIKTRYYEEQIVFLQAQINPHFLYNSFECIRGMAGAGEVTMVREMSTCLAMIYRYCCKGEPYVTLREECACIEKYARIVELCYRNRYRVETDVPEAALACPVPRMILQPLVENSILHGFTPESRKTGTVRIEARVRQEKLYLRIADNGVGMDEALMAYWNQAPAAQAEPPRQHIGIANVVRRIHLLYGDRVRAEFTKAPEGGLQVLIVFDDLAEKTTNQTDEKK